MNDTILVLRARRGMQASYQRQKAEAERGKLMERVYFCDGDNMDIRLVYCPFEGVIYINMAARRDGIVVLVTEEPLIA